MTYHSEEVKQNICEALSMLHEAKDKGMFSVEGEPPDNFVEQFIDLCKLRYGSYGLDIATEAFAHYGRIRHKASFFKATEGYKLKPSNEVPAVPDEFSVTVNTRSCDFGRKLYKFIATKKKIL